MAARKKQVKSKVVVEETVVVPPAPPEPIEPPRKILTRGEIDALARWATEVHYADVIAELRERDRRELLARIDPNGQVDALDRALAAARGSRAAAKSRYLSAAEAASARLGIDVTQCAYDDETGLLTPLPKE